MKEKFYSQRYSYLFTLTSIVSRSRFLVGFIIFIGLFVCCYIILDQRKKYIVSYPYIFFQRAKSHFPILAPDVLDSIKADNPWPRHYRDEHKPEAIRNLMAPNLSVSAFKKVEANPTDISKSSRVFQLEYKSTSVNPETAHCVELRRRISNGIVEYAQRENNSELSSLLQPIFTKKKLVVWSADHHIGPVSDIRSLIEPLGVEFLEHTLYDPCKRFCTCDQMNITKVLNNTNVLFSLSKGLIEQFVRHYSNDSDFIRADALLLCHSATLLDIFVKFHVPVIFVSSLRYDTTVADDLKGWKRLTMHIESLVDNSHNIVGANNKYDAEYIKYFTGRSVDYIPSFGGYTGYKYKPSKSRKTFLKARKNYWNLIAKEWEPKYNNRYKQLNATYNLKKGSYDFASVSSFHGVLHMPYEVSTMSFFEHYRMDIPIFVPSARFLVELNIRYHVVFDRTRRAGSRAKPARHSELKAHNSTRALKVPDPNNDFNIKAIEYWLPLSDYYQFPHIFYFNSVEHLVDVMHNTSEARLFETSAAMRKFNVAHLKQILGYWRRRLVDIAKNSNNRPY